MTPGNLKEFGPELIIYSLNYNFSPPTSQTTDDPLSNCDSWDLTIASTITSSQKAWLQKLGNDDDQDLIVNNPVNHLVTDDEAWWITYKPELPSLNHRNKPFWNGGGTNWAVIDSYELFLNFLAYIETEMTPNETGDLFVVDHWNFELPSGAYSKGFNRKNGNYNYVLSSQSNVNDMLLHEILHYLGLPHRNYTPAIMSQIYTGNNWKEINIHEIDTIESGSAGYKFLFNQ